MLGLFLSQLATVLPSVPSTFLQSLLHSRNFIPAKWKEGAELSPCRPPPALPLGAMPHGKCFASSLWRAPLHAWLPGCQRLPSPSAPSHPTTLLGQLLFCTRKKIPKSSAGRHMDTLGKHSEINCRQILEGQDQTCKCQDQTHKLSFSRGRRGNA